MCYTKSRIEHCIYCNSNRGADIYKTQHVICDTLERRYPDFYKTLRQKPTSMLGGPRTQSTISNRHAVHHSRQVRTLHHSRSGGPVGLILVAVEGRQTRTRGLGGLGGGLRVCGEKGGREGCGRRGEGTKEGSEGGREEGVMHAWVEGDRGGIPYSRTSSESSFVLEDEHLTMAPSMERPLPEAGLDSSRTICRLVSLTCFSGTKLKLGCAPKCQLSVSLTLTTHTRFGRILGNPKG